MKHTILTLTSIAALAGAVNAQTYAVGDYVHFASAADYSAGQGTVISNDNFEWLRDTRSVNLNPLTGNKHAGALNVIGGVYSYNIPVATATWYTSGDIRDFTDNQDGSFQVQFVNANATVGASVGDYYLFASKVDFESGVGTFIINKNDEWLRDSMVAGNTNSGAFNIIDGRYSEPGVAHTTATWYTSGSVSDFTNNQDGSFQVQFNQTVTVPEPSSTALLGLGALGLLVRRKR